MPSAEFRPEKSDDSSLTNAHNPIWVIFAGGWIEAGGLECVLCGLIFDVVHMVVGQKGKLMDSPVTGGNTSI